MNKEMNAYLDHIRNDFKSWRNNVARHEIDKAIQEEMTREFCEGLVIEPGSKYLKVITTSRGGGRSVHSFVCLKDAGKFKKGDILKAASWAAPARNFARGNVLEGNFGSVTWTGA